MTEVLGDLGLGRGQIDVAGQDQHRVVRSVPGAEPRFHVVERGGVEVVHRTDRAVVIGMAARIQLAVDLVVGLAVGLILALPLLVLHHAALLVEHLLVDRSEEVAHAIGLHPQRHVDRGCRHVLEIVRAIEPGRAVHVGAANQFERREIFAGCILRAVEHQMLEEVREPAPTGRLVFAAHVVPDVHRDDRRLAVGVHHHTEAVRERERLEGNVDARRRRAPPTVDSGPMSARRCPM